MASETETSTSKLKSIQELLKALDRGDYSERGTLSPANDQYDKIISSVNILAKKFEIRGRKLKNYERRINKILEILLKYTLMDFSEKIEITELGDELDAIAFGLNTLVEELEAKIVTENKHTQELEKLAIILETTADAVFTTNPDLVFTTWNKSAEIIFGYPAYETIGKKKALDFTSKDELATIMSVYQRAKNGEQVSDFHTSAERKDGKIISVSITITPITTNKGEMIAISGIARDISAKKQSERELKESEDRYRKMAFEIENLNKELSANILQLEESNKELEAFTYSVSHDLRAPLRAIHGYTKVLSKEFAAHLDAEAQEMMVAVMKNAKKMGQLIDDLLSLSRLGRKDLSRRPLNMTNMAKSVIKDFQKLENAKKFKIVLMALPDAYADFGLISQVYTNLLSNAIKYSAKKANPTIEVGYIKKKTEAIYYVKDNGAGFDMLYYNKLFGVFQRLHDVSEFEGTGVGLAIVKRIIQKHNGKVWAEAAPDKGACFYFTLGILESEKQKS